MSKKKIIAIVTVIVLLLAAGISVGVFLHNRGESEAADGSQIVDGNVPTDGTQTGENATNPNDDGDNNVTPPEQDNASEAGDNETVDNENAENEGNQAANNAGVTTDTNVNNVGETTITRVEEQDKLVSEHFFDWWKPLLVKVNQKTTIGVNEPELAVKKSAITGVGGDELVYTGQDIIYVIEVTNNSDEPINNIEIKDKIPQGTSFVSIEDATIEDESVAQGTTIGNANAEIGVKWVVTIPAGETVKAKFTVKVTATEGTISNVAIANGEESTDPTKDPTDPDNETKTSIIKANKSSVITRDGKEVEIAKIGDLITYTITVENTGDAEGTTYITDKVPTGTEFVSTPENEGAKVSENKDSIAWSITLGAKETVTKSFVVKVKDVANGTIVNIANVGGTETNPDNVKVEAYIVFVENGGTEVEDITGVAGEKIENTAMPKTTRHGYVFEGWYAEKELTTKVDKLPETYPAGTTTYYAKWSPVTGLKGIVNYYLKDTTTKLADSKPLTGLTFDTEITETAIDIPGYNKVEPTSAKIKVELEGNEINFYYTPRTDLEGIVNYYLKGTTTKLADSKPLTGLEFNSEITETAIDIPGYNKVEPTSAKITVALEGNEINFYYTARTDIEGVVNYYLKGTTTKLADSKPLTGLEFNSEIEEKAIDIPGYNKVEPTSAKITVALEGNEINFYYTPRTDLTGVVNYYLKDTKTKLADSKELTGLTFNSEIEEKAIDIPGYNKVEPTSAKITVALEGNEINFYYTPVTGLEGIVNYYLKDTTTKLADSKPLTGLVYNSEITEKAIEIAGYNKVEPTSVTITVGLEGNEINFYYTPVIGLEGIVNYYLKDTTTKLAESKPLTGLVFNSSVSENAIEIAGYNKVEPTSVTITVGLEGNEINFYYTPRTDLTGIVNYYLKDTTTKLAESKELTGLTFNSEIEEKAIDIPGYNKVDPTSAKITVALEGNEINFYYTPRTDLEGVVNYYLKDTTTKLADSKELTGLTFNSEIEEKAIDIPGYNKVDPTSAKITVALEGNEINFYYTPRTDLEGVVNYYLKDTTTKLADSKELTGLTFNSEIEEKAIDIPGYNKVDPTSAKITVGLEGNEINFYYTPRTDLTGIVNYYLKDTTTKLAESKELTGLTFNSEIEEKAIDIPGYDKVDPTSAKITVALEGNEINFYYTPRTDLTGIVNYYLKDTTTKLAESKELTGLTFNSEIEEKAIDIPGYDKVDPTSAKITVALEGNEINFYYTYGKSQYTVEYYYEINGNYPSSTDLNDVREGTTLSPVAVTAEDKTPTVDGYIFDTEYNGNVLEGTVTPDGSLVLKVYFKQQLKVVYTKGSQGTFANQEYTVKYGDTPTAFNGTPTGNAGFHFVGWDKDVTKPVTENITFTAIWEGLQVTKTRLEIVDKDNLGNTDYVDQEGDIIRYAITVKNIGDIKAENIVLKDSMAVKVISVEIAGTEVEIANRGNNEFAANKDLLQGLTAGIEPNETIVVTVEHTVTDAEVKAALKADSKIINTATADLNGNPYIGTDKTVDPKDGKEEEGTEVKQRCEYRVEYHYNGQLGTDADDVTESAASIGTVIGIEPDPTRKGYTYLGYYIGIDGEKNGSTKLVEGKNVIEIHYGKAVTTIEKTGSVTVDAGANIEYTLTVTNTGYVGTTVTVSDELVGTTYVAGSANIGEPTITNNVLTWTVTVGATGTPEATKTITFKAATPKDSFGEIIGNTAHIKDGNTIIDSSDEVTTTVNEVTVKYTEWKEGQQGTDLNIIFVLDNSSSMNETATGSYTYGADSSYVPVAPADEAKTRLYNAKEAIKGFISNQTTNNPNTSMSVIAFNTSGTPGTSTGYRTLMDFEDDDPALRKEWNEGVFGWGAGWEYYVTIDGVEYDAELVTGTDGKEHYGVYLPISYGARLVGTTLSIEDNTTLTNAQLSTAVNNISISSERNGFGTNVIPALNMASDYFVEGKKNVIIVLADGAFNDGDFSGDGRTNSGTGYLDAKDALREVDSAYEMYCVGFGSYNENNMKNLSTNNTCLSANVSEDDEEDLATKILKQFNEILEEATGSEQTGTTSDGRITFNEATQTIEVSDTCPIVATYDTGTVDGEGNPVMGTLFTCTSTTDLATYGLTITGEKTITWDAKAFLANHSTVTVPSTVYIKYYIPLS